MQPHHARAADLVSQGCMERLGAHGALLYTTEVSWAWTQSRMHARLCRAGVCVDVLVSSFVWCECVAPGSGVQHVTHTLPQVFHASMKSQ